MAGPDTDSVEQPEEFPLENILCDFIDVFSKSFSDVPQTYKKLIWVNPETTNDFKKSSFLKKIDLNAKYEIKQDLDKLTQLQLASITPTIRLYRRDYKGELLDDYKDRLFLFNNTYPEPINTGGLSREDFLTQQLLGQNIRASNGVATGDAALMSSALTNLQYTFAGRNPVESERAIDVTISMKFSSFEALAGSSVPTNNTDDLLVGIRSGAGPFPSDPTDWTDKTGTNNNLGYTKNFLSLITHPPSDNQIKEYSAEARTYYPNKFRVYLKLGWRITDIDTTTVNGIDKIFPDGFSKFVQSINNGEHDKEMLLNLVNHELTFNEEGEIELKVNYIGSLDTSLMGSDSDFIKGLYELQIAKIDNVSAETENQKAIEAIEHINKWRERNCGNIASDDPIDKVRQQLDSKVQTKKEELRTEKQNALNKTYSQFLDSMLNSSYNSIKAYALSGTEAKKFAYSMKENYRDIGFITDSLKHHPWSDRQAKAQAQSDANNLKEGVKEEGDKALGKGDPLYTYLGIDSNMDDVGDLAENTVKINPWGSDDTPSQIFKLVSVGSLIDGMLQILDNNFVDAKTGRPNDFMKSFFVVLGEFWYHPRSNGALPLRLPIANIPINFDTFLIWFKDNIVAKQRKNYVIKDFLTDFFTQLVIPTLQGQGSSTDKIGKRYNVFFDQRTIETEPYNVNSTYSPIYVNSDPALNRSVDNTIVDSFLGTGTSYDGALPSKIHNVIYVELKAADPDSLGRVFGSVAKDREENVSHFWVGDTKGMIKSVKFKRIEQPGLKEAKATKEAFIPLNQLRDLYNTDISMFGNHYYYPGDLIFVHPQNSILGEPHIKGSISNIMGIGGYYDVIKVSSNIGEGGYETNLECIWTCSGESFQSSAEAKAVECTKIENDYKEAARGSGVADSEKVQFVRTP